MNLELINLIRFTNPWLDESTVILSLPGNYVPRLQTQKLLLSEWDHKWLVLAGPRQAGKTTLGKYISQLFIQQKRFDQLLYLNCDFLEVRQWLRTPLFLQEALREFKFKNPIIFIDEVQRLENPGLLLKGIADLKLPIKMIASGSSQLEIKSTIQEYLTGRHLEALILPLSYQELGWYKEPLVIYGCYPDVVLGSQKELILKQLYNDYIQKDIIEILKIGKPDVMQKLLGLIAHSSGQLVNYNQLASDCRVSIPTIQHYCSILENTYTMSTVRPFVGNKRKELVSNPIFYFIDNGFRNQALRQFTSLNLRTDVGLLIQSAVFQEIFKFRSQHFNNFDIFYWRTQSGAEVDFVVYFNDELFFPIEAKYRNLKKPTVSRSLRSFISAYQPQNAFIITKNFSHEIWVENCLIYFIPFENLIKIFDFFKRLNKSFN